MTMEQLIAEARAHRTGAVPPLTIEALPQALRLMLAHVLESADIESEPASALAQTARLLAMAIAAIEDQRTH
jgi:hypothetical protein